MLKVKLQKEFQLSDRDAQETIRQWYAQRGTFTLTVPEENEFMKSFNPGIDLDIFSQHPFYSIQVRRLNSYPTFQRICSLIALLFMEEDRSFVERGASLEKESRALEKRELEEESETATAATVTAAVTATGLAARFLEDSEDEDEDETPLAASLAPTAAPLAPAAASPAAASLAASPAAAAAAAGAVALTGEKDSSKAMILANRWFLTRLQEIDNPLFGTDGDKKKAGIAKRGAAKEPKKKEVSTYSRICAAQADRHPAVLTKEKYDRMVTVYAPEQDNADLFFNLYPLEGSAEPEVPMGAKGRATEITVMRYGSDPLHQNYYFCPQFFCLYDDIMILKEDFEKTTDRKGNPKPPNSCPFCKGTLITDRDTAMMGATVLERKIKDLGTKPHLYIGFTRTTTHPKQLAFPCCHIKHKTLSMNDKQFAHIQAALVAQNKAIAAEEGREGEEEEPTAAAA